MAHTNGTFSQGSNTNTSITGLTFLPNYLRFTISQKLSTTQNFVHFSQGWTNGTNSSCHSIFQDATGSSTKAYTNRCINHLDRSGTINEIIKATFVSFDTNGGGDFGFTLNFTASDANYQIHFEAYA